MVALRRALLRSRLLAWTLIVLTVLGSSGSWHSDSDDPDFAAPFPHNHAHHDARLDHRVPPSAPTHCAICHWLQAFRSDEAAHATVPLRPDDPSPAVRTRTIALRSAARIDVPSRAPPA